MVNTISIALFSDMVVAASKNIEARAEEFSKLDAALGDGDHGEAMTTAFGIIARIATESSSKDGANFKTMLGDMGFGVMLETSGSTSTLLGGLLLGMSDAAPTGAEIDAQGFKALLKGGLEGVQKNTKAKVGDKTMMDALIPAVEAAEAYSGEDIAEMLRLSTEAAAKGVEATKDMIAQFGRARNLGEKTLGHPDAGATSWASLFETFYNTIK